MDRERWRRAQLLFHSALEREPEVRSEFLDRACGDDSELRREVERLLTTDEELGSFLETPAIDYTTVTKTVTPSRLGREFGP